MPGVLSRLATRVRLYILNLTLDPENPVQPLLMVVLNGRVVLKSERSAEMSAHLQRKRAGVVERLWDADVYLLFRAWPVIVTRAYVVCSHAFYDNVTVNLRRCECRTIVEEKKLGIKQELHSHKQTACWYWLALWARLQENLVLRRCVRSGWKCIPEVAIWTVMVNPKSNTCCSFPSLMFSRTSLQVRS